MGENDAMLRTIPLLNYASMGFTVFEKEALKSLIRPEKEIELLRQTEIPADALLYLRNSDLLHTVCDYSLFPRKHFHRINRSENIVLVKFYDADMNIHKEIEKVVSILTPIFRIQIDFGFLIVDGKNPEDQSFRYVFPQRSLALNEKIYINCANDVQTLLQEFEGLDRFSLLKKLYGLHQTQSSFDKSGYRPYCLLNMVFFLSKI